MAQEEPLKARYDVELSYNWTYGRISRFFRELRDNKKIMGTRCPECKIVFCPPLSDCPKCYVPMEWVEVGPRGTIVAYSISYVPALWIERKPPLPMALIKLDGADTSFLHYLGEIDLDKIANDIQVEVVFNDERKGYITDIEYFRPI
ncbi:MAG: Zn-ribbon domain-containing OB-fold protein [Thermodesulfobacteriota bacterium]|nr:Zn-ribbon domain-containing OB-fold protein [Thermodesulfobacteriota bacterium]